MGSATFIIAAAVLLAAVLLVRGSASVRASWYLRMRCRARRAGRRVALTFDDGPDPQRTPAVLDLLARQGVRATFFVVGARAEAHPELVRRMVAEGHVVGNHSYTHSWRFPLRSLGRTMEELCRTGEVLHRITGRQPRLFRPPFGVTNPTIARAVRRLGLDPVGGASARSTPWDRAPNGLPHASCAASTPVRSSCCTTAARGASGWSGCSSRGCGAAASSR